MKICHGPRTYRLLWPRCTSALASSDEICGVAHSRVMKPHTSAWSGPTWIIVPVYGIPISSRIRMTLRRSDKMQHTGQEVNTASSAWPASYATSSGNLWQTGAVTSALLFYIKFSMGIYPSSLTLLTRCAQNDLPEDSIRTPINWIDPGPSPLWNSTIFHTIPERNSLPAAAAEAASITSFKSQLASLSP